MINWDKEVETIEMEETAKAILWKSKEEKISS